MCTEVIKHVLGQSESFLKRSLGNQAKYSITHEARGHECKLTNGENNCTTLTVSPK